MEDEFFNDVLSDQNKKFPLWPYILGAVILLILTTGIIFLSKKLTEGVQIKEGRTFYSGVIRQGNKRFKDYLKYLEILWAKGMVSENLLGNQQAVVAGEIVNKGNHVVDVVEIEAKLYDEKGNLVLKFVKTPIKPDFPLLPGEIRRFSFWREPFPKKWTTGRLEVSIYGYRFKRKK